MIESNIISKKIDTYISENAKSKYAFAKKVGLNTQTLGNIIERGDLKLSIIYQIVRWFPDFYDLLRPNDITYESTAQYEVKEQIVEYKSNTQQKDSDRGLQEMAALNAKITALQNTINQKDRIIADLSKALVNISERNEQDKDEYTQGEKTSDNTELRIKSSELDNQIKDLKRKNKQ